MIGIIVGISSVITIMSLGHGFEKYAVKNLTNSTDSNMQVKINFEPNDYQIYENSDVSFFNESDLDQIMEIEGVEKVQPVVVEQTLLYITTNYAGTEYNQTVNLNKGSSSKAIIGRDLTKFDGDQHSKVCIIGEQTAKFLNSVPELALGYGIEIDKQLYTVVGIYNDSASLSISADSDIEIPKKSYDYYNDDGSQIQAIQLTINSSFQPSKITNQTIKQLSMTGSMSTSGKYSSADTNELTDGIGKVLRMLTYFITAIAGISLFIAGVGVMNMMYISVSERTREIGISRALGAKRRDICLQFLFEGLFLTVIAGIIGYIIGLVIAIIISAFLPFSVYPDIYSCSLAMGISLAIGLVFSIMPAISAARKDLIEILK